MQNQFQTEEIQIPIYTPPVIAPTELVNQETLATAHAQTVHQWLAKIQHKARRDKKRFWGFFIFFQLFLFLPIFLSNSFPVLPGYSINPLLLAMLLLSPVSMVTMLLRVWLKKPTWNAAELMQIGGVQAVGTLIDLLQVPQLPQKENPLHIALIELLPQMKASDAGLLTAEQRNILYLILKNGVVLYTNSALFLNFRLAILKALEQVGDSDAIPIVEQLASGQARSADQKVLKAAAQECLPLLRGNFASVEANKTLLRASAPEHSQPELLLHPAEFTPDTNPKTLLHAADTVFPSPPVS